MAKTSIKYVQLEPEAFLADLDSMTTLAAGAYLRLILHLYKEQGKCPADAERLRRICRLTAKQWDAVWAQISEKFLKKNGSVFHKRVSKELASAKKRRQAKRRAGLKGAQVTWQRHSSANGSDMANTNSNPKGNSIGLLTTNAREVGLPEDIDAKATALSKTLERLFKPGPRSRKTLAKVLVYLVQRAKSEPDKISWLTDAVEWAKTAHAEGDKPAAMWVAKVKEVTGYGNRLLGASHDRKYDANTTCGREHAERNS